LLKITKAPVAIPTVIEFVDIAGLVKGASKGEGLGNKFLSHIREVDAMVQVVRCFEDPDIHHVAGGIDPVRDIETVITELLLADLEAVQKRLQKDAKELKHGDKLALVETELLKRYLEHLNAGMPGLTLKLTPEERHLAKGFYLLTNKPTIFAANIKESELATAEANAYVQQVKGYAQTHHGYETIVISAQLESDLVDLSPDEGRQFLLELGVKESGAEALIRSTYQLLGLRTFFTANDKELRAWTIHAGDTAPKAAGVIHTDFERGFIKAETVHFDDLIKSGSITAAREKGVYRIEGKDYVVRDGDFMLFKFHV
jgi:hypothetical protein